MPDTCTVTGTIFYADGSPVQGAHVKATVESTAQDQGGQLLGGAGIVSDVIESFTDEAGAFEILLIQGGRFLLHIPFINLRKVIAVPEESSADFKDLV